MQLKFNQLKYKNTVNIIGMGVREVLNTYHSPTYGNFFLVYKENFAVKSVEIAAIEGEYEIQPTIYPKN